MKHKTELIESLAKLLASVHRQPWEDMLGTKERQDDFDILNIVGKYTYRNMVELVINKIAYEIRKDTLEEVKEHIGSKAVPIKGTSYSCGPREWVKFVEELQC